MLPSLIFGSATRRPSQFQTLNLELRTLDFSIEALDLDNDSPLRKDAREEP